MTVLSGRWRCGAASRPLRPSGGRPSRRAGSVRAAWRNPTPGTGGYRRPGAVPPGRESAIRPKSHLGRAASRGGPSLCRARRADRAGAVEQLRGRNALRHRRRRRPRPLHRPRARRRGRQPRAQRPARPRRSTTWSPSSSRAGSRSRRCPADLTDTAAIEDARRAAPRMRSGRSTSSSTTPGSSSPRSFPEQTRDELETITSVNLLALMELTRVVLPGMLERGRGHVVNIASLAGKVADPVPRLLQRHQARRWSASPTRCAPSSAPSRSASPRSARASSAASGMYGRIEHLRPRPAARARDKLPPETGRRGGGQGDPREPRRDHRQPATDAPASRCSRPLRRGLRAACCAAIAHARVRAAASPRPRAARRAGARPTLHARPTASR